MSILAAVLAPFALALAAPWLQRLFRQNTGWVLALLPLSITVYLLSYIPLVSRGEVRRVGFGWVPTLGVGLNFQIDGLSLLFSLLIAGIGTLVVIYSGGYLKGHPQLGRFYVYILMFMGSMLGIALADNIFVLFVFWELTSISSFLLIGFNHEDLRARTAALQALLITAGGGLALMAGLVMLAVVGGSAEISLLAKEAELLRGHSLYPAMLVLVLIGAFTKSAQVPFHSWLPAAMEAPSPVSAYLHSATMVKAGVFLLARFNPVLGGTDLWFWIVGPVGALTMLVGALLALEQTDLKRLLAFSTVSVLGILTMLLGVGTDIAIQAAMTYLLAHAFYKGGLFLVAGTIDHEAHTRDVRELSGLRHKMPLTFAAALLAALSMAGIPLLFGFIGKEVFYEAIFQRRTLVLAIAALTASVALVSVALIVGVRPFIGRPSEKAAHAHEAPLSLWLGPMVLAVFGLLSGLVPGIPGERLLQPAVSAVQGQPAEVKLAIWHGFTMILGLSFFTLLGGLAVFRRRELVGTALRQFHPLHAWGPNSWYFTGLKALTIVSKVQTRLFQSGYLRLYVMASILAVLVLVGYSLFSRAVVFIPPNWSDIRYYELALAFLIVIATIAAVRSPSRLGAIALLGVVGYAMALLYIIFGAPDLAMTQFLVDTLVVVLFILVFHRLPRFQSFSTDAERVRDGIICVGLGAVMTVLTLTVLDVPLNTNVPEFYAENSVALAHGRNIVNVILVDFRALDTLGEITVLGVAGVGVFALLKLRAAGREHK